MPWTISGTASAQAPEAADPLTILMAGIRFSGEVDLLTEKERAELESLVAGQTLDFSGLQALADAVTQRLQVKGHILAGGYLPYQDVTEGIVELEIVEGAV